MKEFIKQMLSAASGNVSSKRVMGCIGWLIILAVYVYCTITSKEEPGFTEFLIGSVVTLLGVDSVTSVFKKN